MADHLDGPRSIGDPSIDLTDLFAFASPENPARTVLAADVFPAAGASALFSNAVEYAIAVRRIEVAGLGEDAAFEPCGDSIRFSFRFGPLEPGAPPTQRGVCVCPDGQTVHIVVGDERGAATPDGTYRVFAGLRSDPFFLALQGQTLQKMPNILQHDNVLGMVVEFDTNRVLDSCDGTLFGVIAETVPLPGNASPISQPPPRFDWIGRPEQTNVLLANPGLTGVDDLRDLWNQQTPFAIAEEFQPLFRDRLVASLENWDMRDGKANWTPEQREASANVLLDDFLLFDVSKPIDDSSHLEIEKNTLDGREYQTGGGRTIDANCFDILVTWLVNRDQGDPVRGGATGATKPSLKVFPYLAPPNDAPRTVANNIDLPAAPELVWSLIGVFAGVWHPLIAEIQAIGTGVGQLRAIRTLDGRQMVERLDAIDDAARMYRYSCVAGMPVSRYTGTLSVEPKGTGCTVHWQVDYLADGKPDIVLQIGISTLLRAGIAALKARFGGAA